MSKGGRVADPRHSRISELTPEDETVAFLELTLPELKPAFLMQYRGAKARARDRCYPGKGRPLVTLV